MNPPRKCSWSILLQTVAGGFCSALFLVSCFLLLISLPAHAIVDTNNNGVSDLWEKQYNEGQLFTTFDPEADPDGDSWPNEVEAISGTNPINANTPTGYLRPTVEVIPAVYTTNADGNLEVVSPETARITWPTIAGKHYILSASADLSPDSWIIIDDEPIGDGLEVTECIQLTQPDGSLPEKLFWRVQIKDTDSDSDLLTDAEEFILGTNPLSMYSDSDFLSDTLEVFNYMTDPTISDSDVDGVPDHDEIALISIGGIEQSRYAPNIEWVSASRSLYYDFSEGGTPLRVLYSGITTTASWNYNLGSTTNYTDRYPLGGLTALLPNFPGPEELPRGRGLSGSRCSSSAGDHYETAWLIQSQIRLHTSIPSESTILKRAMLVHYNEISGITNVDSLSFSIPAGKYASPPQIVGADHQIVPGSESNRMFHLAKFNVGGTTPQGWDDTGTEYWTAAGTGAIVTGKLDIEYGELSNGLRDLLEIVPAPGSESYLSLSEIAWWIHGCNFKIHGLLATPEAGAQIVLRLKATPTVVFATLRVHVFQKRTVPVTIFRIWDSRKPHSWVDGGLLNSQILTKLNETFNHQGNVTFTIQRSEVVDLKRDPKKAWWQADEPLYFTEDGSFDSTAGVNAAWLLTNNQTPAPAKFTVHIVHGMLDPTVGGLAFKPEELLPNQTCFLPETATLDSCAHEVGHCLGLATRAVGQANRHDLGSWPHPWKNDGRVGLMHPQALPTVVAWTRREDWWEANDLAKKLE